MEQQKIDMFILANLKYFPAEKIIYLKEKLQDLDDDKITLLSTIEMKDPTSALLFSLFLGSFGIDRFVAGDIGLGILKLLTAGCCGIMTIIDWFIIQNRIKNINFNKFMSLI